MKKRLIIIGLVLLIIVSGVLFLNRGEEAIEEETVTTEDITERELATVEAYGIIKADNIKNIYLSSNAKIDEIYVREGQQVAEGDRLLALDLSLQQKAKNELVIEKQLYAEESTELARLRKELREEDSPAFKKLAHNISQAESDYQKVSDRLEVQRDLFEQGAITEREFEQFEDQLENKSAILEGYRLSLDELRYNKRQELRQLENSLARQEKKIATLQLELDLDRGLNGAYLEEDILLASSNRGVVFDLSHQSGDYITKETKVLSILDRDSLFIKADVPEEFIKDVYLGAEATITPLADTSREYKGEVTRIASKAVRDNVETIIPVEIAIDDLDDFLLPEFNVDISIFTDEK